jgi:hypothetical protein
VSDILGKLNSSHPLDHMHDVWAVAANLLRIL